MTYSPRYKTFIFKHYTFDAETGFATFQYSFDNERHFKEIIQFEKPTVYNKPVADRALFLAFVIAGISYYKAFPTKQIDLGKYTIAPNQAAFFSAVYLNGLSQFVYENNLKPTDIAQFEATRQTSAKPLSYDGDGISVLQSGGKDSLLLAELLKKNGHEFSALHIKNVETYPKVLDQIGVPLRTIDRTLDTSALREASKDGGLNGHVPVTFITLAYALFDAVLRGQNTVLAAIGREGEESHDYIGDYAVTHQWSKTWAAELLFSMYVEHFISNDIHVGSPLRGYSELKIAELFTTHCWKKYGRSFSSCNVANYGQGHDNTTLTWCGACPKCANSYLLFAPFIKQGVLQDLFGRNLFGQEDLQHTFKGLLGVGGVIKPFECVGEVDELRLAYSKAHENGYPKLPFSVPVSQFDLEQHGPSQDWARTLIVGK